MPAGLANSEALASQGNPTALEKSMVDIVSERVIPQGVADFESTAVQAGVQRYRNGWGWWGRLIHSLGSGSFKTSVGDGKERWVNKGSLARYISDTYIIGNVPQKKQIVLKAINECLSGHDKPTTLDETVQKVLNRLAGDHIRNVLELRDKGVTAVDTKKQHTEVSSLFRTVRPQAPSTSASVSLSDGQSPQVKLKDQVITELEQNTLGQAKTILEELFVKLRKLSFLPSEVVPAEGASFEQYEAFVSKLNEACTTTLEPKLSMKEQVLAGATAWNTQCQQKEQARKAQEEEARKAAEREEQARKAQEDAALEAARRAEAAIKEKLETLTAKTNEVCGALQRLGVTEDAVKALKGRLAGVTTEPSDEKIEAFAAHVEEIEQHRAMLAEMQATIDKLAPKGEVRQAVQQQYDPAQGDITTLVTQFSNWLKAPPDQGRQPPPSLSDAENKQWQDHLAALKRAVQLLEPLKLVQILKDKGFDVTGLEQMVRSATRVGDVQSQYKAFVKQLRDTFQLSIQEGQPFLEQVKSQLGDRYTLFLGRQPTLENLIGALKEWKENTLKKLPAETSYGEVFTTFPQLKAGFETKKEAIEKAIKVMLPEQKIKSDVESFLEDWKRLQELAGQLKGLRDRFSTIQKQYQGQYEGARWSLQAKTATEALGRVEKLVYRDGLQEVTQAVKAYKKAIDALEGQCRQVQQQAEAVQKQEEGQRKKTQQSAVDLIQTSLNALKEGTKESADIERELALIEMFRSVYKNNLIDFEKQLISMQAELQQLQKEREKLTKQVDELVQIASAAQDLTAIEAVLAGIDQVEGQAKAGTFQANVLNEVSPRLAEARGKLEATKAAIAQAQRAKEEGAQATQTLGGEVRNLLETWDLSSNIDFRSLQPLRQKVEAAGISRDADPSQGLEECVELFRTLEEYRQKRAKRRWLDNWSVTIRDGNLVTANTTLTPSAEGVADKIRSVHENSSLFMVLKSLPEDEKQKIKTALEALKEAYRRYPDIVGAVDDFVKALFGQTVEDR